MIVEFRGLISTLVMLSYVLLVSFFITMNAFTSPKVGDELAFSYNTEAPNGPKNWGNLNPNWTCCGIGRNQSPINILTRAMVVQPKLGQLLRRNRPSPAVLKNRGHDIMVEWRGDAGNILINATQYKLKECHWHIPSEHTINRLRFDMELHIVHVNAQKNVVAVIAVLYNSSGSPDPFLEQIEPWLESATHDGVNIGIVNPSYIEFKGTRYYRYNGSLTTPPCLENVIWIVFREVKSVSQKQINALKDVVHDENNIGNARPVQALNGRHVYGNARSHAIAETMGSDKITSKIAT